MFSKLLTKASSAFYGSSKNQNSTEAKGLTNQTQPSVFTLWNAASHIFHAATSAFKTLGHAAIAMATILDNDSDTSTKVTKELAKTLDSAAKFVYHFVASVGTVAVVGVDVALATVETVGPIVYKASVAGATMLSNTVFSGYKAITMKEVDSRELLAVEPLPVEDEGVEEDEDLIEFFDAPETYDEDKVTVVGDVDSGIESGDED